MSFKCKIGLHSWKGCKCSDCDKIRDEQHDWSKNFEKCSICGITRNSGSFIDDRDNNIYNWVKIGDQIWMCENLKASTFLNGDEIPYISKGDEWNRAGGSGQPAMSYYGHEPVSIKNSRVYYNWHAINDSRFIAPRGWHVPTDEEWSTLINYLGGDKVAGIKMKSKKGWDGNGNGTNESGFNATPTGYRTFLGSFDEIGTKAFWWSSTGNSSDAWGRVVKYNTAQVVREYAIVNHGFSIRCVKD